VGGAAEIGAAIVERFAVSMVDQQAGRRIQNFAVQGKDSGPVI